MDNQHALLAKSNSKHTIKEDKSSIEITSNGEDKQIQVLFNPMTNYNPMQWESKKLTIKITWINYRQWKDKIDQHFKYIEQLEEEA